MKKEEWNEGLYHIDPDLVDDYIIQKDKLVQKKASKSIRRKSRTALLIAASFLLIVALVSSAVITSRRNTNSTPDVSMSSIQSPSDDIPIISTHSPSDSPKYYRSEFSVGSTSSTSGDPNTSGISVIARLKETLPDTYTFFDDWSQNEFRLLKMETVTLLNRIEMTDEFYYMIPIDFMTDFSVYHSFVLKDMGQYGYEYSVLYNATQACAEQLDRVIFGYINIYNHYMSTNMMAFDENGLLDKRLWKSNEAWTDATQSVDQYPEYYPETLEQAIEMLEQKYSEYEHDTYYVHLLEDVTGPAKEALDYIKSLDNGLFVPKEDGFKLYYDPEIQLSCRRFINGFPTNETLMIYADSVKFSEARFSEEDDHSLPDLTSAIASVAAAFEDGQISPPHIQNYKELTQASYGIFGWYAKTDDEVLGIVRVTLCYRSDNRELYYDDLYYVVEYGSENCKPIERDTLLERLDAFGTDYIFTGEYDPNGKIYSKNYP